MLPTAPIPVHTAYAVPNGNDRSARAINPKLSAIATAVAAVGQNRVSPSECFSPSAQATSSSPAARSAAQALMQFPAFRKEASAFASSLVENVRPPHAMFARQGCDRRFHNCVAWAGSCRKTEVDFTAICIVDRRNLARGDRAGASCCIAVLQTPAAKRCCWFHRPG